MQGDPAFTSCHGAGGDGGAGQGSRMGFEQSAQRRESDALFAALRKELIELFAAADRTPLGGRLADVGRQRRGDLWLRKLASSDEGPKNPVAAAVGVELERKGKFLDQDLIRAAPGRRRGASGRAAKDVGEKLDATFQDLPDFRPAHPGDTALPRLVIPSVQSDLMAGSGAGADHFGQFASDECGL